MKPFLFLIPLLLLVAAEKPAEKSVTNEVIGCGPPPEYGTAATGSGSRIMIPLPGWGNYTYTITTGNDSAQYFFNQGLNMYYSYHWREANASFREAARFDSTCAMAYWGQALSMGPVYNFAHRYVMPENIYDVLEKMNESTENLPQKEKDLIAAMNARYPKSGKDLDRKGFNRSYATALQPLVQKYPDDLDISALYIDAVMLQHPWNFWNNNGTPKEWTPEVVTLCEKVLNASEKHPGALHYYIHLIEASKNPQRATKSADILLEVLPGVAHMVHMSSHVYERNGSYAKGVEVNEKADQNLMHYDSLARGLNLNLNPHVPHYFAVQAYCALTGGIYKKGLPLAERAGNFFPELMMVRMGRWHELLNYSKPPDKQLPMSNVLYHFSIGLAYLHTGKFNEAKNSLTSLRSFIDDPILKEVSGPSNAMYQPALIALNILEGSILFEENKKDEAVRRLHAAIETEDQLNYVEPKDWMLPARQFLGAYLMQLKKYQEAEKIYREDLEWNPGNGWSLVGLYKSLVAQGKSKDAEPLKQEYMKSFSEADEIPPGSVYLK